MNATAKPAAPAEPKAHVYDFGPIYDGRCIYCDCRAYGRHHDEPCRP